MMSNHHEIHGEVECSICSCLLAEVSDKEEPVAGPSTPAKRSKLERKLKSTECGHVFHENCILTWLDKNKTCGFCRKPTKKEMLRDIFLDFSENGQCRKCKMRVTEVGKVTQRMEEMEKIQRELKGKLEGKEEIEEQMKGIQRELQDKLMREENEVKSLNKKMMEMVEGQRGLQEILQEKEKQILDLEDNAFDTEIEREWDRSESERKLAEMAKDCEKTKDQLTVNFEEAQKNTAKELEIRDRKLQKIMKLKEDLAKKLSIEEEENKFAKAKFVERMRKRVIAEIEKRLSGINGSSPNVMQRKQSTIFRTNQVPLSGSSSDYQTTSNPVIQSVDLSEDSDDEQKKKLLAIYDFNLVGYLRSSDDENDNDNDDISSAASSTTDDDTCSTSSTSNDDDAN